MFWSEHIQTTKTFAREFMFGFYIDKISFQVLHLLAKNCFIIVSLSHRFEKNN